MMKRIIGIVIALAVIASGIAVIRHRKASLAAMKPPATPAIPVNVGVVRDGSVSGGIVTVGLIQAETASAVAAQVGGSLIEVRFHEGDVVKKGERMARIDPRLLDDAVTAAQARAAAAREDETTQQAVFARDQVLFDNQAISQQALDASRARLAAVKAGVIAAEQALESARTRRAYAEVAAPYDGVVTARLVEPGDLATPGRPLYTVQAPGPVKVISKVAQSTLAQVVANGSVTFEYGGRDMIARISRIHPALDAAHLGTIETDLPESPFGLSAGATVSARYGTLPARGLVVPADALLEGTTETLVVRVTNGKAQPVTVSVLSRNGRDAAVDAPIRAGDVVVTGLPSELMALTAGTPVAPREK